MSTSITRPNIDDLELVIELAWQALDEDETSEQSIAQEKAILSIEDYLDVLIIERAKHNLKQEA